MSTLDTVIQLIYLAAAACFVLGLHQMNSPATARNGNRLSAVGMAAAVVGTVVLIASGSYADVKASAWIIIAAGLIVGGGLGYYTARTVQMTAMPQLVSIFNAVGGGAAALIAIDDYIRLSGAVGASIPLEVSIPTVLDVIIGGITFTGSVIAAGKLQGLIGGQPIILPGSRILTAALAVVAVVGALFLLAGNISLPIFAVILLAGLLFGVTMVLPIGGADMPVVISLLNSFTGTAVAMAGFVLSDPVLIIAGALVGASGAILTKLMADAMNRSVLNIMIGGFGTADAAAGASTGGPAVRCGRSAPTTPPSSWPTPSTSSSCPATAWPWRRPSTASASWPSCSRPAGSTSSTPSIRWPAACRVT